MAYPVSSVSLLYYGVFTAILIPFGISGGPDSKQLTEARPTAFGHIDRFQKRIVAGSQLSQNQTKCPLFGITSRLLNLTSAPLSACLVTRSLHEVHKMNP
jgi:hypothetical protein